MGQRFLIDTNIVIYFLNGLLPPAGKKFVKEILQTEINISIISKIELLSWNPPEDSSLQLVNTFLRNSFIYQLDDDVANKTASLRRNNKKLKISDTVIAATAIVHDFSLVTHNLSDFTVIKDLKTIDPFKL
jgi:predicted nucleic acid-binding protein